MNALSSYIAAAQTPPDAKKALKHDACLCSPAQAVRNNSIDICRYICALLVVAIHTAPFSEINANVAYFISPTLSRIAVPFFLIVAGYFYTRKLKRIGAKALWPYVKKILRMYVIWSAIWLVWKLAIDVLTGTLTPQFIVTFVRDFLFLGTVDTYWYFPAVIYSTIILTFLYCKCRKLIVPITVAIFLLGAMLSTYSFLGFSEMPFVKTYNSWEYSAAINNIFCRGFTFFVLGYLSVWLEKKCVGISTKRIDVACLLLFVLMVLESYFFKILSNGVSLNPTVFLYPFMAALLLCLLRHPLPGCSAAAHNARVLANFTYLAHPFFVNILLALGPRLFGYPIPCTVRFAIVVLITLVLGLIIVKADKKPLNALVI